jgi:hypothetical protein
MSKRESSLVEDNYVPMIGCFVAGFVVNRLMNHQDVVTGDVKEGFELPNWAKKVWEWSEPRLIYVLPSAVFVVLIIVWLILYGLSFRKGGMPKVQQMYSIVSFVLIVGAALGGGFREKLIDRKWKWIIGGGVGFALVWILLRAYGPARHGEKLAGKGKHYIQICLIVLQVSAWAIYREKLKDPVHGIPLIKNVEGVLAASSGIVGVIVVLIQFWVSGIKPVWRKYISTPKAERAANEAHRVKMIKLHYGRRED